MITQGKWKAGVTYYHPEYKAWLTMIVTIEKGDNPDDQLCVATVYGRTQEESQDNASLIVDLKSLVPQQS
jgi:hypothetical protein